MLVKYLLAAATVTFIGVGLRIEPLLDSNKPFSVVSDRCSGNVVRECKVLLHRRVDRERFLEIAEELRAEGRTTMSFVVNFYLRDMALDDYSYASVTVTDRETIVSVAGFMKTEQQLLDEQTRELLQQADSVVGVWQLDGDDARRLTIYHRQGRCFLTEWIRRSPDRRLEVRTREVQEDPFSGVYQIQENMEELIVGDYDRLYGGDDVSYVALPVRSDS